MQVRFSIILIAVEVVTVRKEEVERAEMHEMDNLGPHISSVTSPLRSVSAGQDINDGAKAEGVTTIWSCCRIPRRLFCYVTGFWGGSDKKPEINVTGDGLTQAEAQIRTCFPTIVEISNVLTNIHIAADNLDPASGPRNTTSDSESKEPRMIGDFDGSANEFWKLYRDEAKSHDDATISTLKDGMDSALIFVRSYSVHAPIIDLVFLIRGHRLVYSLPFSQHS
jgi:hypothetical protein